MREQETFLSFNCFLQHLSFGSKLSGCSLLCVDGAGYRMVENSIAPRTPGKPVTNARLLGNQGNGQ